MTLPHNKKFAFIIAVLSTILVLCFLLCACDTSSSSQSTTPQSPTATTFVSIDVNPSIEMVLDQNNRVMSVYGANEDAQLLLWQEDSIVGVGVDLAMQRIINVAKEMGYVTNDAQNVNVTIETSLGSADAIFAKIEGGISSVASNLAVNNEANLSLLNELKTLKQNSNGKYYDLSLSFFRLVKSAMQNDTTLNLDDAIALGKSKLIAKVKDAQSQTTKKLGDAYSVAVNEAQFALDNEKATLLDVQYVNYLIAKFGNGFVGGGLGNNHQNLKDRVIASIRYMANHQAYVALAYHKSTLEKQNLNPQIDENCIDDVLDKLKNVIGDEEIEQFKQTHTNHFYKGDILSFVNKLYRNASPLEREQLEQNYDDVLLSIEEAIYVDEKKLEGYQTEIEKIFTTATSTLSGMLSFLASSFDEIAEKIDYNNVLSIEQGLESYQARMQQAYNDMMLNEEDLQAIEALQDSLEERLSSLQTDFTNTLKNAREYVEELLTSRKNYKKQNPQA